MHCDCEHILFWGTFLALHKLLNLIIRQLRHNALGGLGCLEKAEFSHLPKSQVALMTWCSFPRPAAVTSQWHPIQGRMQKWWLVAGYVYEKGFERIQALQELSCRLPGIAFLTLLVPNQWCPAIESYQALQRPCCLLLLLESASACGILFYLFAITPHEFNWFYQDCSWLQAFAHFTSHSKGTMLSDTSTVACWELTFSEMVVSSPSELWILETQ